MLEGLRVVAQKIVANTNLEIDAGIGVGLFEESLQVCQGTQIILLSTDLVQDTVQIGIGLGNALWDKVKKQEQEETATKKLTHSQGRQNCEPSSR